MARNARAAALLDRAGRRARAGAAAVRRGRHPADALGRRGPVGGPQVVDAMPASDGHALVMKSTVPCGTGANIKRVFRERGKAGFSYVSCPEFLKEGTAVEDFLHPDRIVVGDDGDWAGEAVGALYEPLAPRSCAPTSPAPR